jgi:hypothetical protein
MAPNTSDEEIAGLLGENLLRVWEKVEDVRDSLKQKRPSEKMWKGRKNWEFDRKLFHSDRKFWDYDRPREYEDEEDDFNEAYWG